MSESLLGRIMSSEIGQKIWSDHATVFCHIDLNDSHKSYKMRFLNKFLLHNPEYNAKISEKIQQYF